MNLPPSRIVSFSESHQRRAGAPCYNIDRSFNLLKLAELRMEAPDSENSALLKNSVLYKEFLAEREEILRHKWLESEKAGHDIGFEKALLDWIVKYRSAWRDKRQKKATPG